MLGKINVTEANLCDDILVLKIKGSREPAGKILNYIGKKLAGKKEAVLKVDEYHPRRSLSANRYLWILCHKLSEKIGFLTKEEVYQKAVREAGQFETVTIKEEALFRLRRLWCGKGLGWFTETIGESDRQGMVDVIIYFGSSIYDSKEMSTLVNYVVEQCKEQGIETMTPNELKSLCENWKPEAL